MRSAKASFSSFARDIEGDVEGDLRASCSTAVLRTAGLLTLLPARGKLALRVDCQGSNGFGNVLGVLLWRENTPFGTKSLAWIPRLELALAGCCDACLVAGRWRELRRLGFCVDFTVDFFACGCSRRNLFFRDVNRPTIEALPEDSSSCAQPIEIELASKPKQTIPKIH